MQGERSDEELMLAYQLGDDGAFNLIFSRYSGRLLSFLIKQVQNKELADDIFQAAFLKLHKSRRAYKPEIPLSAWIFTICRSEMLDALRQQKRRRETFDETTIESMSMSEDDPTLEIDMQGISAAQKTVIDWRFTEELSFAQIAQRLRTSPENARQILSRAIRVLRKTNAKR